MTAVLNTKSTNITTLDTLNPFQALTTGEGAPARLWHVEDQVVLPTTFFSSTNNYVRVCRFPTNAKIKKLEFQTDAAVDAAATTGATTMTWGVMFSDSTIDGTPVAWQGLVPSTVGIGGGTTTAGTVMALPSASGANALFGVFTPNATTNPIPLTDLTFNGTAATYGDWLGITEVPVLKIFNLWDQASKPIISAGYFDIFMMSSHVYTTVPSTSTKMFVRLTYTI